jgi:hypothetical protein
MSHSTEVLAELDATLEKALCLPTELFDLEELAGWACGLQRSRARLDALLATSMYAAEQGGVAALSGALTAAGYVAAETGCKPEVARSDRRLGGFLRQAHHVAVALAEGRISRAHAERLQRAFTTRTEACFWRDEEELVGYAESLDWRGFQIAVGYWELLADPDGNEPKDQYEGRSFSAKRHGDGTVTGSFRLDPITGEAVINAVNQEAERLRREDLGDIVEAATLDEVTKPKRRTQEQLRADAFARLVAIGATRPDGTIAAPLVHLTLGQHVAEDILARVDDPTHPVRIDPITWEGRCELVDGTPIHPSLAASALLTGILRRVVFSATGELLDLGRSVRCFPRHLKDALKTRSRGTCEHPSGCQAPHTWLDADHINPWTNLGPTSTANGRCRCVQHNRH